jgi:hypothetical protein
MHKRGPTSSPELTQTNRATEGETEKSQDDHVDSQGVGWREKRKKEMRNPSRKVE